MSYRQVGHGSVPPIAIAPEAASPVIGAGRAKTVAGAHAWRGVLIGLIVLGHNRLFESHFYGAYRLLYNFHVEAFLLIPFLRRTDRGRRVDWLFPLKAYYRPFCVFVTAYAALFALSGVAEAPRSVGDAFMRYAAALGLANSAALDRATGFEMFWFLPVFIVLATIRPLLERATRAGLIAALLAAAALHVTVGYLDAATAAMLPWGLPIVCYMLFPCLIAATLARSGWAEAVPVWAAGAAFVTMIGLCFINKFWINLSDFKVYDAGHPGGLIVTDTVMIAASLVFYRGGARLRSPWLDALGRHSLQIYLIHGVIGYALVRLTGQDHTLAATISLLAVTYAATLLLSFLVARWMMRSPIGGWIFAPR
ncbi:acyltransferase [Sphingomonas sp. NFR15]|uniref:acyltransferase family protein n=1 Tax=Sphingomonas sp. NFR15 TaxID=1566282 RepID=UPI00088E489C|nr:acyltransferase [Sphingomonas sp. NFR15]SDA22783.1 Fucose 4-O-acetylase [Sphingomonas sp. NFR15]